MTILEMAILTLILCVMAIVTGFATEKIRRDADKRQARAAVARAKAVDAHDPTEGITRRLTGTVDQRAVNFHRKYGA